MSVTSVSFAFVRFDTDGPAAAAAPARQAAPQQQPQPPAPAHEHHGVRKSPLVRALMGALSDLVAHATPPGAAAAAAVAASGAETPVTTRSATEPSAPAATDPAATANATDLDDALLHFARALAQALRGHRHSDDRHDEGGEHRRDRHHGHHHHHDRLAVGDSAQRIEALGARLGAARSGPSAVATTPAAPQATPVDAATALPTTASSVSTDGRALTPVADAATASGLVFIAVFGAPSLSSRASPLDPVQDRLIDAFVGLQQALGQTVVQSRDDSSVQLAAFLQALVQRLGGEGVDGHEATAAGALVDVSA